MAFIFCGKVPLCAVRRKLTTKWGEMISEIKGIQDRNSVALKLRVLTRLVKKHMQAFLDCLLRGFSVLIEMYNNIYNLIAGLELGI